MDAMYSYFKYFIIGCTDPAWLIVYIVSYVDFYELCFLCLFHYCMLCILK